MLKQNALELAYAWNDHRFFFLFGFLNVIREMLYMLTTRENKYSTNRQTKAIWKPTENRQQADRDEEKVDTGERKKSINL